MEILLQQIINGLVLGSMYALVALGYTMVYGIINLINFAHGEVLMVGAITSWWIITNAGELVPGLPGWLLLLVATLLACVVAAALNFTIEKVAYRAYSVTDDDIAAVRAAGLTEDQIFEIVVCAAIGQANRQYTSALASVANATGEREGRR